MVGATEESAARKALNIDDFEASLWIGLTTAMSSCLIRKSRSSGATPLRPGRQFLSNPVAGRALRSSSGGSCGPRSQDRALAAGECRERATQQGVAMEGWLVATSVGTPGASPVPECGDHCPRGMPLPSETHHPTQPALYHIDTTYLSPRLCDGGNSKRVVARSLIPHHRSIQRGGSQ